MPAVPAAPVVPPKKLPEFLVNLIKTQIIEYAPTAGAALATKVDSLFKGWGQHALTTAEQNAVTGTAVMFVTRLVNGKQK